MSKVYLSTKELCERFQRGRTTIYRWMDDKENPFPKPTIGNGSGKNLWKVTDVENWEKSQEKAA